jgi:hypothetical protein
MRRLYDKYYVYSKPPCEQKKQGPKALGRRRFFVVNAKFFLRRLNFVFSGITPYLGIVILLAAGSGVGILLLFVELWVNKSLK